MLTNPEKLFSYWLFCVWRQRISCWTMDHPSFTQRPGQTGFDPGAETIGFDVVQAASF